MMQDEYNEYSEDEILVRQMKSQQRQIGTNFIDMADDDQKQQDVEDVRGKLSQWVKKKNVIQWIGGKFMTFLRTFQDEKGVHIYEERIHQMCNQNSQSLKLTFTHLSQKYPTLAIWLAEEPSLILPIFNQVAFDLVLEVYPKYYRVHEEIYIRVSEIPVEDNLRDLR